MQTLNDFVGNKEAISKIINWLNACYHNEIRETNYVVLQGVSGNGKTELVLLLAKSFDVALFRITPSDIENQQDLNDFIKSVNITTLEGKKHKLILIDDLDDYSKENQKKLFELPLVSKHPIIYACKTTYFDKDFLKNGMYVKLKKPLTSELMEHLKTISDLPEDKLKEIALESKSFRSAILSVKNASVNELLNPNITKRESLRSINDRKLMEPINRENINFIFKSIKGYDKNALLVMLRFADFDYRIKAKFEEIEPYLVNKMIEPIEKVKLDYVYNEDNHNGKKKESKKTEDKIIEKVEKKEVMVFEKEPKKIKKPLSTLDKFL